MAPGGPLGLRGGNGRADGRDDGPDAGGADAGPGAGTGGGGGALVGRGAGGGAEAPRAGGFVVRLPFDFAGEFEATVARAEAGAAGAAEPVRAGRAMLGCWATSERGPLPLGGIRRQ
jgi:hypothetical protein